MSNTSYDFNLVAGTSFLTYVNCQDSNGSYINFSGFAAQGYVKNQWGDTGYILKLNVNTVSPFESGILSISGSSSDTMSLPAGSFIYDIEIYNNSSVTRVLDGDFNIFPSTYSTQQQTGNAPIPPTPTYIVTSSNITLSSYESYFFTGVSNVVWTLPLISTSNGTLYLIKNRGGASITLSGQQNDKIYSSSATTTFQANSGEAYILSCDGYYWNIS
jgi:hypothetical protein